MTLRPLGKNVLIKPIAEKTVSAGGIVLPHGEKTGARLGEVVAVANGIELAVGARVFYGRHDWTDAGDGRVVVNIDSVLAVLG